jgi:predicted DNA-binding protein
MSQSQRDLRRAAAREFQKSLDQLGSNLQSTKSEKVRPTREETAIEEALADIEQFMQSWNA